MFFVRTKINKRMENKKPGRYIERIIRKFAYFFLPFAVLSACLC
ncbi:hypothetical protein HMPREF2534_04778 [Bacteroides thetaiotaomicron]|nr:hypothetical protein HMPREF2534_04778 [Bacteroides thetaiotaomicron]